MIWSPKKNIEAVGKRPTAFVSKGKIVGFGGRFGVGLNSGKTDSLGQQELPGGLWPGLNSL